MSEEPRFFNRELSWLAFNQRVLDEANDAEIPILERLKFLAITASNLDEFFMVRVGGLQIQQRKAPDKRDPSGMTAAEQLAAVSERTHEMAQEQYRIFAEEIEPQLEAADVRRLAAESYSQRHLYALETLFDQEIFAIYSPQAVADKNDFPQLTNQSLNICVQLAGESDDSEEEPTPRFAIIPLGREAQRIITLHSDGGYAYTLLEDVVELFVARFFAGIEVQQSATFRISRNADIAVDDESADFLQGMEEILGARKQTACVRLEISSKVGATMLQFLQEVLEVNDEDVFKSPGPVDLAAFMQMTDLPGFDQLKYEPWPPLPSPEVDPAASMFEVISRKDVLLVHPYESFEPVVRLIEEAADDPDVLAIKQTLYRTSKQSPIIAALKRAAERGKHVTAILELKARFDEARNIEWAKDLEQADVQVIYGVRGLKTHAKICIIIRREPHGIQRYLHVGTGNYNESTARLYGDISYMTCNEELGGDATNFFNAITGYSQPQDYRKLEAAPAGLRDRVLDMIETETLRKRQGQKAHIAAKINSLADPKIINALYEASQAGVSVKLNIRGICCLRPGVPGLSENIEVINIIDRFLEHARIFYFFHGGDERVFISSADWMPRNLDRRVELLIPIEDTPSRHRLVDVLDVHFRDNVKARQLQPDGTYARFDVGKRKLVRSQESLYDQTKRAVNQEEQYRRTIFQPHRPESTTIDES